MDLAFKNHTLKKRILFVVFLTKRCFVYGGKIQSEQKIPILKNIDVDRA